MLLNVLASCLGYFVVLCPEPLPNSNPLLFAQGKFSEAEQLYESSQAVEEKILGPEHPDVATSLNNRAGLLQDQVRAVIIFWGIVVDRGGVKVNVK